MQQIRVREEAAATGGETFMNMNGLAQATQHILDTDGDYYTLTYSPKARNDGKWHSVKVALDQEGNERNYLYLAVWDVTTGRLGTLEAEVDVAKP